MIVFLGSTRLDNSLSMAALSCNIEIFMYIVQINALAVIQYHIRPMFNPGHAGALFALAIMRLGPQLGVHLQSIRTPPIRFL